MSVAPFRYQSMNPAAIASSASALVRSAPVAATLAMQIAIWVSSDHSPAA